MRQFTANGKCGRIIRGTTSSDFLTLTDDPTRKVVMLMGPDGLEQIQGKSGYEALNIIGYEPDYIKRKVEEGNSFKLVTFPEGRDALLATWDNVSEIVRSIYPSVYYKLKDNLPLLKRYNFEKIEAEAGFDFSEVDKNGFSDDRYMTIERYEDAGDSLEEARAFLYFTLHLRELFSGDGYTYSADGTRGLKEYFIPNMPIADIDGAEIFDIDVQLPKKGGNGMNSILTTPLDKIVDMDKVGTLHIGPPYTHDVLALVEDEVKNKRVLVSSKNEGVKRLFLIIDAQNDFICPAPLGTLSVPGAVEDTKRTIEFIYNNLQHIDRIALSIDSHRLPQIFFKFNWRDQNGNKPDPYTVMSTDKLSSGEYSYLGNQIVGNKLISGQQIAKEYVEFLEENGRQPLTIWDYHCLIQKYGAAIEYQLMNMITFHEYIRNVAPRYIYKGTHVNSEMYGIFMTEDRKFIDADALKLFEDYDEILVAGQAKSHCVLESINQVIEYFEGKGQTDIIKKMTILEDLTSPIPIPEVVAATEARFTEFKNKGINIINSTDFAV